MTKRKRKSLAEKSVFVTITIPPNLLEKFKNSAKLNEENLSEFFREAGKKRLKRKSFNDDKLFQNLDKKTHENFCY